MHGLLWKLGRILVEFLQWLEFGFRPFNQAREEPRRLEELRYIRATESSYTLAIKNVDSQGKESGIQGGLIRSEKHRKKARGNTEAAKVYRITSQRTV